MTRSLPDARAAATPATEFHDPTTRGGYVPHRDDLLLAPERAYEYPSSVLQDDRLSTEEKRAVLQAWREKQRRLANPPGDEPVDRAGQLLGAIEDSLRRLGG